MTPENPHEINQGEQDVTPNACPASSSSLHDHYNLNPVFHSRPRSGVGGLDVAKTSVRGIWWRFGGDGLKIRGVATPASLQGRFLAG
jgi:hypothetical protein